MIKCPQCGRENDDSFKFCLDCGNPLQANDASPEPAKSVAPSATTGANVPESPANAPATENIPSAPAEPSSQQAAGTPAPAQAAAAPEPKPSQAEVVTQPPPAQPQAAPTSSPTDPSNQATLTCPKCGSPIEADDAFCASCGQNLKEAEHGSTMFMHTVSPGTEPKRRVRLVLVKPDGTEGTVFTLAEKTVVGRSQGMIMFPKDPYISPKHAEISLSGETITISDLNSLNGIYRKMTKEEHITPGTYFRIGRQLLRLEVPGEFQPLDVEAPESDDSQYWGSPAPQVWARLVQVLEGGKIGEIHLLTQAEVIIGREDGEVRFPEDGFISARHCKLLNKGGDCFLFDLNSSNGTYLRINGSHELKDQDRIQIGNQVLRIDVS